MASTALQAAAVPHCQNELPDHYKGVKALIDAGIDRLPQIYIRPPDQRPVKNPPSQPEDLEIPLIDLSDLEIPQGRAAVVDAIGRACQHWGFFLVKNHGVSASAMEAQMRVGREFFDLPVEEKMVYFSTDPKSRMRYATSFNVAQDKILNWRDFLRYSCHPLEEMKPLWPCNPKDFREVTAEYCTQIRGLARKLLSAISESLGVGAEYIIEAFGDNHSQIMACNLYPACPDPDLTLGLVGHADPGAITILMQDVVGGLQVLRDDRWVDVRPVPGTLVINVGDQIQVLSNDRYKSAVHRVVVNSQRDRMSVPTAYGPSLDAFIAPAPPLLDASHPPIYRGCVYGEYMDTLQSRPLKRLVDSLKLHQSDDAT